LFLFSGDLPELRFFPWKGVDLHLDPSAFQADAGLLLALEKHASMLSCNEDLVLFHQGESPKGLHILKEGKATISMDSDDGRSLFSCEAVAGSLLGLPGLIGNQPYSLSAVAHKGARVGFIARDDFQALMQSDSCLMVKVLQVLAAEVRSARMAITQK
jgi:CRP-like cAMP-binding protein